MTPNRSRSSAWIVFLIGVSTCWSAAALLRAQETRTIHAAFSAEVEERQGLVQQRLEATLYGTELLSALHRSSGAMDQDRFDAYVDVVRQVEPAVLAMSWNVLVPPAERAAFEAERRGLGDPEFTIVRRDAAGEIVAADPREPAVVLLYNWPPVPECVARGFDLRSDPRWGAALDEALASGSPVVTEPQTYDSREPHKQAVYAFQRIGDSSTVVATLVQLAPIVNEVLASLGAPMEEAYLVYERADGSEQVVFASDPTNARVEDGGEIARGLASTQEGFTWGDLTWRLVAEPPAGYVDEHRSGLPLTISVAGLMIFGLLALSLRQIERRREDRTRTLAASNQTLEEAIRARTAELQDATSRLSTLLTSEPECVKIIDAEGRLHEMNPAGLAMVEADSLDEVYLANVYDLVQPHDRDRFREMNERVCNGESLQWEFEIEGLKGTQRCMETYAVPIADPNGDGYLHLAVTRDVTEKRQILEERIELEGKLRDKQRLESLGTLAGGIAHDFNNLLHVITGRCEHTLDDPALSDAVRESVAAIATAGAEGARLCDQLLTYLGQAQGEREALHLGTLVDQMIGLLDLSHSANVQLEVALSDDEAWIEGDATQLNQIALNLVTNASEAIGERQGRIDVIVDAVTIVEVPPHETWVAGEPAPGRYARLRVKDDGDGIAPETIGQIFDPFYTTKFTGRGLGLASCLGIVRGHSGFLSVASRPGQGAEFTVLIPTVAAPHVEVVPSATPGVPALLEETVLVVDDEPSVLTTTGKLLRSLGLKTIEVTSGREAVQVFLKRRAEIDLVLLDWTMPGMDGLETVGELRTIDPDLPAVLCSGYSDEAIGERVARLARVTFLQKPFRRDQLVTALQEVLQAGALPVSRT